MSTQEEIIFNMSVIFSLDCRNVHFCLHKCYDNFLFLKKKYNFTLIFLTVLLVLIQALSLSACNNVNLFITEMEQGKHL